MDWSHGVEYWSGFLEWNIGSEMLKQKRNINSAGKKMSRLNGRHSETCYKRITHISNAN